MQVILVSPARGEAATDSVSAKYEELRSVKEESLSAKCARWLESHGLTRAWLDRAAVKCEILMLTLVMGCTEIDDPVTLGVFGTCGLVLVNGTVFLACAERSVAVGVLAAVAVDLGAAAAFWKVRHAPLRASSRARM